MKDLPGGCRLSKAPYHHPKFSRSIRHCLLLLATALLSLQAIAADLSELSPGDVIRITVYGNPDLTTVARIAANGRITFPLLGDVGVGGMTAAQAERTISRQLDQGGFVRDAQVGVFVESRNDALDKSVTILGEVRKSGRYSLQPDSADSVQTLIDALAIAGGINDNAADHLFLIRQQGPESRKIRIDLVELLRKGDVQSNLSLNDGDIVLVPVMDVFYIYGQVQRPGRYRLERSMTVMQALSVASGVTPTGNEKGIVLNRQGEKGMQSIDSELTDELRPDDVIYVKARFF